MINYSLPTILLKRYIREYCDACNKRDYARAYEIAVDISDLALQLENAAQELANGNAES